LALEHSINQRALMKREDDYKGGKIIYEERRSPSAGISVVPALLSQSALRARRRPALGWRPTTRGHCGSRRSTWLGPEELRTFAAPRAAVLPPPYHTTARGRRFTRSSCCFAERELRSVMSSSKNAKIDRMRVKRDRIRADLVAAALLRENVATEAWDHGWSVESYRRSGQAAMSHRKGLAVSLPAIGVSRFEEAAEALLSLSSIREQYYGADVWELLALLIGTLPLTLSQAELDAAIGRRLSSLLNPPAAFVVFPLANVAVGSSQLELANTLIGVPTSEWHQDFTNKTGVSLESTVSDRSPWWLRTVVADSNSATASIEEQQVVLFAWWGKQQFRKGEALAAKIFDDIVALAIALQPDLDALGLYSLRGDSHRPGERGLTLDRQSLGILARHCSPSLAHELGSELLVRGVLGVTVSYRWKGEEPFPLGKLLERQAVKDSLIRLLAQRGPVEARLVQAARWHAKAHWSDTPEDAVLALGVALEAMFQEEGGSPGRVLAERFALLDPERSQRPLRYRRFLEYYSARSSVAHGAKSSRSQDFMFVRQMAADMRAAISRVVELSSQAAITSEKDYSQMFERLKWGL
jgi:hypothetical protein